LINENRESVKYRRPKAEDMQSTFPSGDFSRDREKGWMLRLVEPNPGAVRETGVNTR